MFKVVIFIALVATAIGYNHQRAKRSEGTGGTCKSWWCYHSASCAPGLWAEQCPKCGGSKQSPINIEMTDVASSDTGDLAFSNFAAAGVTEQLEVLNNGHTVEFKVPESWNVKISGSILPVMYRLLQFHFHWGSTDAQGSEHSISNQKFPVEMHMVFLNVNMDSIAQGVSTPSNGGNVGVQVEAGIDGVFLNGASTTSNVGNVVVLSTLIDAGAANGAYDSVIDAISMVTNTGVSGTVEPFSLEDLLPQSRNFYHYSGSFTTPTCDENIEWFVFKNQVELSPDQIAQFRTLMDAEGNPLVDNWRPVQPLNGRVVFKNYY